MSQDTPGGPVEDDEEAPPTTAMPDKAPVAARSTPGSGPPAEPRKPTLPPVPASVPRPTTSRSQRPDAGASQPPPAVITAGSSPPTALSAGAVPPAPRAPHIEAYDSEVTTEYDPFGDDAPTADYDPRARGVYHSSGHAPQPSGLGAAPFGPAQSAPPPPAFKEAAPPASGPPPVPTLASDRPMRPSAPPRPSMPADQPPSSQRRRSSRRTVRIPNDVNERAAYRPGASGPPEGEGSDYESFGEADIIRPMPILNIGSQPPSRLHTPARPQAAMQDPAISGPSAHEDYEQGWTPLPSAISDSQETLPIMPAVTDAMLAEAGMIPPGAQARHQGAFGPSAAPTIETHDEGPGSESEPELELIEEPAPVPPPPPPPPPPKPAKATTPAAPPAAPAAAPRTAVEEPAAKKVKPWWEDLFGDDYIRTMDRLEHKHVLRETNFIEESLGLERGAVILDLACGEGQHSVELAARGYNVVGFDLSLPMLSRAADEAQERKQKINFLHGDMREMAFDEMFDGIFCWSTSFGYFDDERNYAVLQRIHRALRQGGNFLLDVVNRDYVASRAPSLVWFEGEGCTCMDDMHVDFFTSRLRVKRTAMFDDGHSRELDYSIRLYTLHELGKMLHEVGFKVVEVTGHPAHAGVFFGAESPRMIILAERA